MADGKNSIYTENVPGTGQLCPSIYHFQTTLLGRHSHSHFIDDETEAQKLVSRPGLHGQ